MKDWLVPLTTWLSSAYPVGAFAYSQGLEWAVEARLVHDAASTADYIATYLERGGGWIDQVLVATALRAAEAKDLDRLDTLCDLASSWRGSAEAVEETAQMGASFVLITQAAWPDALLRDLDARRVGRVPYAVALGTACGGTVPLEAALLAYGQSLAANLMSAAIRLVPLGQTAGYVALATLAPLIARVATAAADADLEQLSTAAPGLDLAAMRHETQYTRLFRS